MFYGEYTHVMDSKGRVSLPAKFRNRLSGEAMLVKGLDDCLWLFTEDGYRDFVGSVSETEAFDPDTRRTRRFFGAGSEEIEIDSAGRIRIPATLREHAHLAKDVTIAGAIDRIELWDSVRYAHYSEQSDIDELTAKLSAEGKL
jgi:MraZ protein